MISNSIAGFTKGSRVAGPSRSWELVFSCLHYLPISHTFHALVLVSPNLSGSYVGYTRRQVCYLAAKALTGAHLDGTLPQDTLFFPPQVSQSRRSHSCSLGACQHRCNEVVIEMASHAICQRKACWVVRFETPNQNVLGSFCFHLEWSECFTLLYDFKVLNCNGFASRSATNEREREILQTYSQKTCIYMFMYSYCIGTSTRCVFPAGPGGCLPRQDAFGRALFALLATCAADPALEGGWPWEKSGGLIQGDTGPPGDSRNLWIGKMCGEK